MVRPRKAKSGLRQYQASAWLTESEYQELTDLSDEHGVSISSFCRNLLVNVISENKKRKAQVGNPWLIL